MTLEEARGLVGALVGFHLIPGPRCTETEPKIIYATIDRVDDQAIWLFVEDPDCSTFRCVPGDGYAESLELVEAPRLRPGGQGGE